jgi:Ca-activated chloride channel family protein
LLGKENRFIVADDFDDDVKGAEIVEAGHSVTALYEIVIVSDFETPSTEILYEDTAYIPDLHELLAVDIRYKVPGESFTALMQEVVQKGGYSTEMSSNLKFAAAVAELGMILSDSQYKGTSSFDGIISMLAHEDFSQDVDRQELIELVLAAKE